MYKVLTAADAFFNQDFYKIWYLVGPNVRLL